MKQMRGGLYCRYSTGLDKNVIGDYFGDPDDFCLRVLDEFTKTFDFSDMGIDAALRIFLESFRLPGEAQKIHRVVEAFAERYYQQSKGILASKDVAFVLSYSVILLNTDQHNVQVCHILLQVLTYRFWLCFLMYVSVPKLFLMKSVSRKRTCI